MASSFGGYWDYEDRMRKLQAMGYSYNDAHRMAHGFSSIEDPLKIQAPAKKEVEKKVSIKHYRVIKENFLWEVGAILDNKKSSYKPINDSDLWDLEAVKETDAVPAHIVENSPTYFERVYPVNLLTKTVYKVKAEAVEMMNKDYKSD